MSKNYLADNPQVRAEFESLLEHIQELRKERDDLIQSVKENK
jgi:cell division protein FtsL